MKQQEQFNAKANKCMLKKTSFVILCKRSCVKCQYQLLNHDTSYSYFRGIHIFTDKHLNYTDYDYPDFGYYFEAVKL